MKVLIKGEEQELFTIGETAKRLKKSVETLRAWERSKTIPKPLYKHGQVRLYHPEEVEVMKKVIKKLGKYARRLDLQREMWLALAEKRRELLNGQKQD